MSNTCDCDKKSTNNGTCGSSCNKEGEFMVLNDSKTSKVFIGASLASVLVQAKKAMPVNGAWVADFAAA